MERILVKTPGDPDRHAPGESHRAMRAHMRGLYGTLGPVDLERPHLTRESPASAMQTACSFVGVHRLPPRAHRNPGIGDAVRHATHHAAQVLGSTAEETERSAPEHHGSEPLRSRNPPAHYRSPEANDIDLDAGGRHQRDPIHRCTIDVTDRRSHVDLPRPPLLGAIPRAVDAPGAQRVSETL